MATIINMSAKRAIVVTSIVVCSAFCLWFGYGAYQRHKAAKTQYDTMKWVSFLNGHGLQAFASVVDGHRVIAFAVNGSWPSDPEVIRVLPQIKNLEAVQIQFCDDQRLKEFGPSIATIHELWCTGLPEVTDQGLANISSLCALHTLGLGGAVITDDGLKHVSCSHNLRELYLNSTRVNGSGVTLFPLLERLSLNESPITHEGMAAVGTLRHLKTLALYSVTLTSYDVVIVTKLSELEDLDLGTGNSDNLPLSSLIQLKHLTRLSLSGRHDVLAADLDLILKMPSIQFLQLDPIYESVVKKTPNYQKGQLKVQFDREPRELALPCNCGTN
jgi:Leucine-rich repeat (LRR) protein